MDNIAGVLRNAELIINDNEKYGSSHIKYHRPSKLIPKSYQLYDGLKDFHLTVPQGRFVYRDSLGKFTNKKIHSLNDVGHLIAKNYDYYACAASKYFYFLTGSKVSLQEMRKTKKGLFIDQLAKDLKKNQNLQSLIYSILKSNWFN